MLVALQAILHIPSQYHWGRIALGLCCLALAYLLWRVTKETDHE